MPMQLGLQLPTPLEEQLCLLWGGQASHIHVHAVPNLTGSRWATACPAASCSEDASLRAHSSSSRAQAPLSSAHEKCECSQAPVVRSCLEGSSVTLSSREYLETQKDP